MLIGITMGVHPYIGTYIQGLRMSAAWLWLFVSEPTYRQAGSPDLHQQARAELNSQI